MKAKKALNTEIKLSSRTTKLFHTIKRSNWSSTPVMKKKQKKKRWISVKLRDLSEQILNDIELKFKIRLNYRLEIYQPETEEIFSTIIVMIWNKEAFISMEWIFFLFLVAFNIFVQGIMNGFFFSNEMCLRLHIVWFFISFQWKNNDIIDGISFHTCKS